MSVSFDYNSSSTPSVASSVFDDSDDDGECKICGKTTPSLSGLCRGCERKVGRHAPRSAGYARILKNATLRRSRMKYKRDRVRASLDEAAADTDFMLMTRDLRRNEQDVDEFAGLDDEERDLVSHYTRRQDRSRRQQRPTQAPYQHPPSFNPFAGKEQELAQREAELALHEQALSQASSGAASGDVTPPPSPVTALAQTLHTTNFGENTPEDMDDSDNLVDFA